MHVTRCFGEDQSNHSVALLSHDDEHVRAWAVQLLCEDREPGAMALARFQAMAETDPSATVRLYLASALQRLTEEQRWPLLAALASHEEDNDDHILPLMLWYALEPLVVDHPQQALTLAVEGKMPHLQQSVARRMVSGEVQTAAQKEAPKPENLLLWNRVVAQFAPGFEASNVGEGGIQALTQFRNEAVMQTHPKNRETPCQLTRHLAVPEGKRTTLKIRASYHPHGDWQLRVRAGEKVLSDAIVSYETVQDEWFDLEVDLTQFAGQHLDLVVENGANDWKNEFGYWSRIEVVSK
jgi:hypothetical protein